MPRKSSSKRNPRNPAPPRAPTPIVAHLTLRELLWLVTPQKMPMQPHPVAAFGDDLARVLRRHYRRGLGLRDAAAFMSFQAYAALDQIAAPSAHEIKAKAALGPILEQICEDVPGWIKLEPPVCTCGATMYRDRDLWQCGAEHCRNFINVH